jgi:hypothetical protein
MEDQKPNQKLARKDSWAEFSGATFQRFEEQKKTSTSEHHRQATQIIDSAADSIEVLRASPQSTDNSGGIPYSYD